MRSLLRKLRSKFHPLFFARKYALTRLLIRVIDRKAWLSVKGVNFKVRGRLLTHGLAFAVTGSQEVNPEALVTQCARQFHIRSFWDVGANIGYYTWLIKSISRDIETVLFEPLPDNAALVRDTLKRNAFPKATLIAAGASDCSGQGEFRANLLAGATSTLEQKDVTFEQLHWGVKSKVMSIPLVTIDEVRARFGPVDLMKIDVEGHEASVFRGARATIESDQPLFLVECSHPHHACLAPLESAGYTLVDADRLSLDSDKGSINYLCVPPRFASSIPLLLDSAMEEVAALAE